jgi:hypothetical protein
MRYFTVIFLLFLNLTLVAEKKVQVDCLYYYLNDRTYPYTATVTDQNKFSFSNYANLTEVLIPDSIVYRDTTYHVIGIDNSTFSNCSSLESIRISNNIKKINSFTFQNCVSLSCVILPDSLERIEKNAFQGCTSLSFVLIPNTVKVIEQSAFEYCLNLSSITIPENAINIGRYTFYGCLLDTTNFINNSTLNAAQNKYWGIRFRQDISKKSQKTPKQENLKIDTIQIHAPSLEDYCKTNSNYILYSNDGKIKEHRTIWIDSVEISQLSIPNTVAVLDNKLFYNCSSISSLVIPTNLKKIGLAVFEGCFELRTVVWNAKDCKSRRIANPFDYPFFDIMENITSFTFGQEVEHIPSGLCAEMHSLTEIILPQNLRTIGDYSFSACSNISSIIIPKEVESIGKRAFSSCSSLTSVIWAADSCHELSLSHPPFGKDSSRITSFIFSETVRRIPSYICYGMNSLNSVSISDSVEYIGWGAFAGCVNLANIEMGQSVKNIESYAFRNCESLTSMTIPKTVTTIGNAVFDGCKNLSSITFYSEQIILEKNIFKNCSQLKTIFVPKGTTQTYVSQLKDYDGAIIEM